jgi:GNAT superfamily N-acetyltransferase
MAIVFQSRTADRWPDLEDLFGPERGANSGCWCLWPRVPNAEWQGLDREARKARFRAVVEAGPPPGILAYDNETAVGWVSVGPRPTVVRFNRSRLSRDETRDAVFAITCFYVRSGHRRSGIMPLLLDAAIAFARENGASAVDACPIDTERKLIWGEGFVGLFRVFQAAGFVEVARRSPTRPLMRLKLKNCDQSRER